MNNKFPKIAFILFVIAAGFLVIDGFITKDYWYWAIAVVFLVLAFLFALDMNKKDEEK